MLSFFYCSSVKAHIIKYIQIADGMKMNPNLHAIAGIFVESSNPPQTPPM